MKRDRFLRALRKAGHRPEVVAGHGKGSHVLVILPGGRTTIPQTITSPGFLKDILEALGLPRDAIPWKG